MTLDNGPQPLAWVGQKTVRGRGAMAPVTIRAGTFGTTADLTVSPNHRILVEGPAAEVVTGCSRVLVAEGGVEGVTRRVCGRGVEVVVEIEDSAGDGLTVGGGGSYSVLVDNQVVASGSDFGAFEAIYETNTNQRVSQWISPGDRLPFSFSWPIENNNAIEVDYLVTSPERTTVTASATNYCEAL